MGFAVNLLRGGDDCEKAESGHSPFPASGVHRTVRKQLLGSATYLCPQRGSVGESGRTVGRS